MTRYKRLNSSLQKRITRARQTKTNIIIDLQLQEISPVFNKPGSYYDRVKGIVWDEVIVDNKLLAFQHKSIEAFAHELSLKSHIPLTSRERAGAEAFLFNRNNKELRELLLADNHWHELRATYRRAKLKLFRLSA